MGARCDVYHKVSAKPGGGALAMVVGAFLLGCAVVPARAWVMDWASLDWTAGNTVQSFANVGGSGITVTIDLGTSTTKTNVFSDASSPGNYLSGWPDDAVPRSGESGDVLWLRADHSTLSQYVSALVSFTDTYGNPVQVANITLRLEDIDSLRNSDDTGYRDRIYRFRAENEVTDPGTLFGPTGADYVDDSDPSFEILGSGTSLALRALPRDDFEVGTDTADAEVYWGPAAPLTRFYYRYGNASWSGLDPNPVSQYTGPGIMAFDSVVDFDVIPEPSTFAAGAIFLALACAASLWSRTRRSTRRPETTCGETVRL